MARILLRDLRPATTYYVQFRASDGDSVSDWSRRFALAVSADTTPPDAVTLSTWASVGPAFSGTWTAVNMALPQNMDFDHYEFNITNGSTTQIIKTKDTSYTLSFETNRAMFGTPAPSITAKVRTVDATGNASAYSNSILATNPAPAPPTGGVVVAGTDSLDISWTAPSDSDLVGYNVYTGATSGFTPSGANRIYTGQALRFTYTTTTYSLQYFKIRSVDAFGQESTDLLVSGTPTSPYIVDVTAPSTPTSLAGTITNNANGVGAKAAVTWVMTSPPADLAGYNLRFRAVATTNYQYMAGIDSGALAVQVILDLAYTNYEFQIQAYDFSDNKSAWSATTTVTSPTNATPATPTGLTSASDGNSITYAWTGVADLDIKNYEVTFSTSSTFASGNITYLTGTATTLSVGGLTPSTTYYARVRANDTAGLSGSFTTTDTRATAGAAAASDGVVPGTGTTPNVLGRFNSLYVTWAAVTVNASAGAQLDTVTYEVHLSTTTGFTPVTGTKVSEVSGTAALISNLPTTNTALSYGTTYFIKIVPKDRDGAGAASAQGSGTLSKVASTDVTSIGADLIVPGSGFIQNLVIGTGGSIQSSDYSAGTAGYKLNTTGGLELNVGAVKASVLTAGTIGSSTGVIQVAAGASIVMNGGYLKSNTYTGTAQATNPSGAGFYLGNDGIRIDQGIVSAAAITTGTIGAQTITIGTGGSIVAGTWTINNAGITIPNGAINAASLNIQTGANMMPQAYADFEWQSSFYSGGGIAVGNAFGVQTNAFSRFNTYSMAFQPQAAGAIIYMAPTTTTYNIVVQASTSYIVSYYAMIATGGVAQTITPNLVYATATTPGTLSGAGNAIAANSTWARYSFVAVVPGTATGTALVSMSSSATTGTVYIDGIQVEQQLSNSSTPSTWKPPGATTIIGDAIRTGSITSSGIAQVTQLTPVRDANGSTLYYGNPTVVNDVNNRPAWSINAAGAATLSNLNVTGNVVVGDPTTTTATQNVGIIFNSTSGLPTIVGFTGSFYPDDVGLAFSGPNIPAGSTIISYQNSQGVTLSANATLTASAQGGTIVRNIQYRSQIASSNYLAGSTGWVIRSDGYAEFQQLAANSISGNTIQAGTLSADTLTAGTINADVVLSGSFKTQVGYIYIDLNITTAAPTTVTTTSGQFYPDDVGASLIATGIPAGTTIVAYVNATTVTTSQNSTATTSALDGQIFRGRQVIIDTTGVSLITSNGSTVITLPTNPATSAVFTGSVVANSLVVQDLFQMQGVNNTLGQNSQLSMSSGILIPGSGPNVSFSYTSNHLTAGFNTTSYNPSSDQYVIQPNSLVWDDTTKHYYFTSHFFSGAVQRFWGPGGSGGPTYQMDYAIDLVNVLQGGSASVPHAMSIDASNFYFLTKNTNTAVWRFQKVTRTGIFRSGGPVAGDLATNSTWDETLNSGLSGFPAIATYGGNNYIAKINTNSKIVLYKYTGLSGTGTLAFSTVKSDIVTGNVASLQVGKFDMGGTNVYAVVTVTGPNGGRNNFVYLVNTSSFDNTNYSFPIGNDKYPIGTTWNGIDTDNATGNFQTLHSDGSISNYTNLASVTSGTSIKASMAWRQTGAGGTAGLSYESPITTTTMRRRATMTITAPTTIPSGSGANAVAFKAGVDSGTRWRYDDPAVNVITTTVTALRTTNSAALTPASSVINAYPTASTPAITSGTPAIITNNQSGNNLMSISGAGDVSAKSITVGGGTILNRMYFATVSITTNASGVATLTHNLGFNPTANFVTSQTGSNLVYRVSTVTTTTITVTVYDVVANALKASATFSVNYLAMG